MKLHRVLQSKIQWELGTFFAGVWNPSRFTDKEINFLATTLDVKVQMQSFSDFVKYALNYLLCSIQQVQILLNFGFQF